MTFRKRNVVISDGGSSSISPRAPQSPTRHNETTLSPAKNTSSSSQVAATQLPGIRPSPVSGMPTTSTGAPTLDALCGGHGGIPLGSMLLIEESSTTDFAGALLRYYAAEGVAQGHQVLVLHSGPNWVKELPGVTGVAEDENEGSSRSRTSRSKDKERMKIAWRYEGLGSFGSGIQTGREAPAPQKPAAEVAATEQTNQPAERRPFCHTFDLTKRMEFPNNASKPEILQLPQLELPHAQPPFHQILRSLSSRLANSPPTTIVRIVIPNFLSPMLYPPSASQPQHSLQFLHSLRSLLRRHTSKATAMVSFPLALYPRSAGFVRWAENMADGVLELTPLSSLAGRAESISAGKNREDAPQGLVRVWKAIDSDRSKGRGSSWSGLGMEGGDDLAFTLTRKRFGIVSYSLPPADGDSDSSGGNADNQNPQNREAGGKQTKVDLEF